MSDATPNPTRVLLVEDDHDIAETTKDLLEFSGFVIHPASGARPAQTVLATEPVDIVVTDVVMPDGDGHELVRHIRSTPALRHLPVIMVSAKAEKKDLQSGLESGANRYLTKPYTSGDLIRAIEETLASQRQSPRS